MIEQHNHLCGTTTDPSQQETDMAEQEWIDWHPKDGDVLPEMYQIHTGYDWVFGVESGRTVKKASLGWTRYRIPAPRPTEARPPWIDPQCKFRWGDRVKVLTDSRVGKVAYVVNPHDLSDAGYSDESRQYTVLVATSLSAAVPYETAGNLHRRGKWLGNYALDRLPEDDLELYPEDLPQHFDDRLLDADGPHKPEKVPREVWVNEYPNERFGNIHLSYADAEENMGRESVRIVHFREVL